MTKKELLEIIRCGETSQVQFKERFSTQKQMAEEFAAFANSKGGMVIIGAEDKTGEIKGLTYEEIQITSREVGNAAQEHVRPTIYLQTESVAVSKDRALLVVKIDEGVNKPYKNLAGDIFVKQGSDKRRVTENSELLKLFHQSGTYNPDQEMVRDTSSIDVDRPKIEEYTQKNYGKSIDEMEMPYEQLLTNLHVLTPDGHCTLAGLLFFGKNPQQYEPAFMIKAVSFYGTDMGGFEYRDSKDLTGTIPALFDQGMSFLKSNLHSVQEGQSFNSTGKLEISEIALEEILQNALVHREYITNAPIRILIFDNRVEIISPGALPAGMTVNDLKFGNTMQRNHLIASFCSKTMQYRGIGTGIIRAMRECKNISFENYESGNQFKVTFRREESAQSVTPEAKTSMIDVFTTYPNLIELCPTLPKTEQNNARIVLHLCQGAASMSELMAATGYESRTTFRRKILLPLLDAGLIAPTLKEKQNSPQQKYIIER